MMIHLNPREQRKGAIVNAFRIHSRGAVVPILVATLCGLACGGAIIEDTTCTRD